MPRINYGDPDWNWPKDGRLIPQEYIEQLKEENFEKPITTSFSMQEIPVPYKFRKRPVSGDKFGRLQPTYFANSQIFSERIPQRKEQELGEVCVDIFDDGTNAKNSFLILVENTEKRKEAFEDYQANYLDVLAETKALNDVIEQKKLDNLDLKKNFISRFIKRNKINRLEKVIYELELKLILLKDKLEITEEERNCQYKIYINSYNKLLNELEKLKNKDILKKTFDFLSLRMVIPNDDVYFDEVEEMKNLIKKDLLIEGFNDIELKENSALDYLNNLELQQDQKCVKIKEKKLIKK